MDAAHRLLLVEDDPTLRELLEQLLTGEGYHVDLAPDGQRGLHLGLTRSYDAIVLDRGLPAIEGLDLLMRLRAKGVTTPTLVLSALDNPMDRVIGLDAGAEDYVGKPFDLDELLARLRALVRRHHETSTELRLPGGWRWDSATRTATSGAGAVVVLSPREQELLETFARSPRQVFARRDLLVIVFDGAEDEGLVDTYVHYLRRKLGRGVVATVRGLGYRLGGVEA
ncbi:MAG TPA: response regulator transcription factor [Marmoricola sp.]|nr:response regulator transcription factor [Marmoricola sp.]